MTTLQKVIKYLAMAFAVFLAVSIIGGILGAVGLFGGLLGGDAVAEDVKTYAVSSDVSRLEVEINAADFTIKQGESFSVESNLKHLTVADKNGVLTIKETKTFGSTYTGAVLTLYIPVDTVFEKANITTGAGRLTADTLSADALKLELGAGEVNIGSLTALSRADIEGGAGKLTISGGALADLDLQMGVGQLNLASALTGNCEIETGVGEANITVLGSKEDYKLDIEKGIGSITVDGKSASDFGSSGSGQHAIQIDCGVGAVHIAFKEEQAK